MKKIVRAKTVKKYLFEYGEKKNKNLFIYAHFRGVHSSRFLGFCVIRDKLLYKALKKDN